MGALTDAASRGVPRAIASRGLQTYAGLVFAHSPIVGALLAAATLADAPAAAGGAAAVVVALGAARALGVQSAPLLGSIGVSALLVGLGIAHTFAPGVATALVLAIASVATAFVASALTSILARVALPVLALAFVLVFPLAVAAGMHAGLPLREAVLGPPPLEWTPLDRALSSLGAVLFLPRWDVGACVLVALLVHSRIATVYATLALVLVGALAMLAPTPLDPSLALSASLNAWLTAVALGGVWFVPSASSLVVALGGSLVAALIAAGLATTSARLGMPLLIAPFWVASALFLLAMRQRAQDERPKAVDFEPGTPEQNLRYHRTRRARFASLYPVTFALPFRGRWTCTQAVDGRHTHKGPWRFAFDFEVQAEDGSFAKGGGHTPEDHHCYGLPVLAAAAGTVVAVEASVPDVRVGGVDVERNWGNYVVLAHGHGIWSLVAHLAPGSIKVLPGQVVARGDVLGSCGSSGRAPRPHLHFQLQAGPELGAPTLPCRFVDAVRLRDGEERLERELVPVEGDVLRAVSPDAAIARVFDWPVGHRMSFDVDARTESLDATVTLLGQRTLGSASRAALPYDVGPLGFLAYDASGDEASIAHLLRVALPRLPFDGAERLSFTDLVPLRAELGAFEHTLLELVAPFTRGAGLEMHYRVTREAHGVVVVSGRSAKDPARGVATRVVIDGAGIQLVEVRRGARARVRRARRVRSSPAERVETERSQGTWIGTSA